MRCQLTLQAGSQRLASGEATTLAGRLECPEAATASGQPVSVYEHEASGSGSALIGEATTQMDGSFTINTGSLTSNSVFYARSGTAHSRRVAIKVTPLVTLTGSYPDGAQLAIARHGASASTANASHVTFAGTVSPAETGATVVLLRQDRFREGQWLRIGLAAVAPDGSYQLTHTFRIPGEVMVRTLVRMRGSLPAVSEPVSYTIVPRQNPSLTISASANPVAEGQPVTITGTVAGAAGAAVKLLARTGQCRFTVVAEGRTNGGGGYEFAGQLPLRTTAYQVQAASKRSTVLLVGVKYALTQARPEHEVVAGRSLSFSGTLAPSEAGHQVFLQRESASGVGFHTVEEGITGADGSYSITHLFAAADAGVYRIAVPREAGLLSSAGAIFTVKVTPAGTAPAGG